MIGVTMGWLRLVGSSKLQVSFAKEPYKRDYILHKRPIIVRSLLIVANPYHNVYAPHLCFLALSLACFPPLTHSTLFSPPSLLVLSTALSGFPSRSSIYIFTQFGAYDSVVLCVVSLSRSLSPLTGGKAAKLTKK